MFRTSVLIPNRKIDGKHFNIGQTCWNCWMRQSYLKRISILLYIKKVVALRVVWMQNTGLSPETDLDVICFLCSRRTWQTLQFSMHANHREGASIKQGGSVLLGFFCNSYRKVNIVLLSGNYHRNNRILFQGDRSKIMNRCVCGRGGTMG